VAGGLIALLDDVAALVKLSAASLDDVAAGASRAGAKATGVVIDDAAVTPKFVEGVSPKRELPIIERIALGSLVNKIVIILPIILLLSQFLPWLLTPLLMVGGTYLCFEGAEKVFEKLGWIAHHEKEAAGADTPADGAAAEKKIVRSAITTDFVLSCEIMVIALNEVVVESLTSRAVILIIVALAITLGVYGVVALIVKMDDIGLHLAKKDSPGPQRFGRILVGAMPKLLTLLSVVGTFAMLWVGGHIILVGTDELGFHALYGFVHHLEVPAAAVPAIGGILGWVVNTVFSLILGAIWGGIVVAVIVGAKALFTANKKNNGEDRPEGEEHAAPRA
jgi:predicted DNA repair protein MutK